MKIFTLSAAFIVIILNAAYLKAGELPDLRSHNCVDMESIFHMSEEARIYSNELEEFTKAQIKNRLSLLETTTIVIPVVFHVFGDDFAGTTVTEEKIRLSLQKINEDFKGLNDDYDDVDPVFLNQRGTLNIEFRLATKSPSGDHTSGIIFYQEESGLARTTAEVHEKIAGIAWDNYSYMNVYICLDLMGDGVLNNSGFAWYPNKWMSDLGIARVVYNGRYLYGNTDKEFASVMTHEFGHWLNLIHTFEGGCTMPNDHVDDTPMADKAAMGCRKAKNCNDEFINGENYMDYNASCYKMFTIGQVERMLAALESETRKPLWQYSNLEKTGTATSVKDNAITAFEYAIHPNPATEYIEINPPLATGDSELVNRGIYEMKIFNMLGECVEEIPLNPPLPKGETRIDVSHLPRGVYYIRIGNLTQMFVKV